MDEFIDYVARSGDIVKQEKKSPKELIRCLGLCAIPAAAGAENRAMLGFVGAGDEQIAPKDRMKRGGQGFTFGHRPSAMDAQEPEAKRACRPT